MIADVVEIVGTEYGIPVGSGLEGTALSDQDVDAGYAVMCTSIITCVYTLHTSCIFIR